jgi:hypothetical protein
MAGRSGWSRRPRYVEYHVDGVFCALLACLATRAGRSERALANLSHGFGGRGIQIQR